VLRLFIGTSTQVPSEIKYSFEMVRLGVILTDQTIKEMHHSSLKY
jgi:hypothetical protein